MLDREKPVQVLALGNADYKASCPRMFGISTENFGNVRMQVSFQKLGRKSFYTLAAATQSLSRIHGSVVQERTRPRTSKRHDWQNSTT